ncbi:MAG: hypothetical protein GY935_00975, partial [Gammaproteobacteria bacterium]|nr:hypothetical protein [Gammaproteobacteria bacterium]
GSVLDIELDREISPDLTSSIQVFDDADQLIAAGDTQTTLLVPDNTESLHVVATVQDDFGNQVIDQQSIRTLDHFRLQAGSNVMAFNTLLPAVDYSYIAQGRSILDNEGQVLAEFNSTVTALEHIGERVIVALEGIGLIVADPFNELYSFRQLSIESLSGRVSHLQVNNDRLMVIVDGEFKLYSIDGNAIELLRDISVSGAALDGINSGSGFVLLAENALYSVDQDGESASVILSQTGLSAMAPVNQNLLIASRDSNLQYLDASGKIHQLSIKLDADQMIPLGGDVLALNDAGQLLVVDAREIKHSEVIGTFDLATGPGTNAAIAQG